MNNLVIVMTFMLAQSDSIKRRTLYNCFELQNALTFWSGWPQKWVNNIGDNVKC